MTKPLDEIELRTMLLIWVNALILQSREEGLDEATIMRGLGATAVLAAAQMHHDAGGSDQSFMRMAQRSLSIVGTGAMEQ